MNLYKYKTMVPESWIDYNGHMNDAEYSRAFSDAALAWMSRLGFNEEKLKETAFTIFTLENHIVYLKEVFAGEEITIKIGIHDYDAKRLHSYMTLHNEEDECCATYEVMYMCMDTKAGRPGEFPEVFGRVVRDYYAAQGGVLSPETLGRTIGIRR